MAACTSVVSIKSLLCVWCPVGNTLSPCLSTQIQINSNQWWKGKTLSKLYWLNSHENAVFPKQLESEGFEISKHSLRVYKDYFSCYLRKGYIYNIKRLGEFSYCSTCTFSNSLFHSSSHLYSLPRFPCLRLTMYCFSPSTIFLGYLCKSIL
jgi:hypothetical protein